MIPLLIGLFLFILFVVFVVLSASTWRGWHITAICLTFLAAMGFVVVLSMSQRTHMKWKEEHAKVSKDLATEQVVGVKLEIGDPLLVEPDEPSLIDIQEQLHQQLVDRGRIWRQCRAPNPPANNQIVLSTVPPNEDGTPGDPTTADNGINQNMILYGFREAPMPLEDGTTIPVPVAYLGEFLVVAAQPDSVTLTPTLPLDRQQAMLVNDTAATWALYEMMPLDTHSVFADKDTLGEPLDNTTEQPIFGAMGEPRMRQLFAAVTGLPPDADVISELIMPYLKDGYAASVDDVNMYPANIWQKLEFEKAHTETVDSNNLDPGITGGYFDSQGLAEATRLRAGDKATFRVNDIGVFPYSQDEDKLWVDDLVNNRKICQKIAPIYVRSLNDYEEAFHDIQERFVKRTEDTRRTQRDIDNLNTAIRETQEEIAYRQAEREKLREDQTGFARDNQKIDELVATLESQKSELQKELSQLYRTNLALSQQLALYSATLEAEINRRASSVAVQ